MFFKKKNLDFKVLENMEITMRIRNSLLLFSNNEYFEKRNSLFDQVFVVAGRSKNNNFEIDN